MPRVAWPPPCPHPGTGTFLLLNTHTERSPPQGLRAGCTLFGEYSSTCPSGGCPLPTHQFQWSPAQSPPTTSSHVHSALMASVVFCGFAYCPPAQLEFHATQGCLTNSVPSTWQTPGPCNWKLEMISPSVVWPEAGRILPRRDQACGPGLSTASSPCPQSSVVKGDPRSPLPQRLLCLERAG